MSLNLNKSNDNLIKLVHRLWNTMTREQKDKFLKNANLDRIIDSSKLWFELIELQQFEIIKSFLIKLGLQ